MAVRDVFFDRGDFGDEGDEVKNVFCFYDALLLTDMHPEAIRAARWSLFFQSSWLCTSSGLPLMAP
jgi:hypothetical protein